LSRVRPILRKYNAFFKIPARPDLLASLNAGLPDFAQVGKFLTVYPRSTAEATTLARELHLATRGLPGPRIPFDARYRANSLVHYRYGAFRASPKNRFGSVRDPAGKLRADKRGPGLAVPDWLENPFPKIQPKSSAPSGPIGIQLLPYKVKMQRGKGGVYEALDLSVCPPRRVILKEGRRHGETDWLGLDGYARLKHEGWVLRSLRKAGLPVPLLFREFTQNGNHYLVLERIAGRPLIASTREQPKQLSWGRAEKIWQQLEPVLSRIHAAGWVWRDCKPSHIFVHRGQVRLIDFEEAGRVRRPNRRPWRSKNYCRPNNQKSRISVRDDDYALGVIAFQFGTGKFPPASAFSRAALYKRTKCPRALREKIDQLLTAKIARRLVK
jgi:serine/threonine protein kinase